MLVLMVPGSGLAVRLLLGRGTSCGYLSPKQLNPASGNPEMGSPAIPKLGTIGTQQDSRCYLALFACQVASGLNIGLVSGARLVPHSSWVLALWLLFAGVWIEWPFLHGRKNFCSYIAILRFL